MGYNECDAGGEWVTEEEARDMGRRPCGFCY
jgi:hypothetical protein